MEQTSILNVAETLSIPTKNDFKVKKQSSKRKLTLQENENKTEAIEVAPLMPPKSPILR